MYKSAALQRIEVYNRCGARLSLSLSSLLSVPIYLWARNDYKQTLCYSSLILRVGDLLYYYYILNTRLEDQNGFLLPAKGVYNQRVEIRRFYLGRGCVYYRGVKCCFSLLQDNFNEPFICLAFVLQLQVYSRIGSETSPDRLLQYQLEIST